MNFLQISGLTVIGIVGLQALLGLLGLLRRQWYERRTMHSDLKLLEVQLEGALARSRQAALLKNTWNGVRKFEVVRKVEEGPDAFSFYLHPHDNQPLPPFLPGQYLTFHLRIPGHAKPVVRCYSLSDWHDPNTYRVTIKRAAPPKGQRGIPAGLASSYFCDQMSVGDILDVESPRGKFYLEMADERPVVFIGGGIGVTPLLCMLNALVAARSTREIWFFLSVRDQQDYLFREHLEDIARQFPNVRLNVCFSGVARSPQPADAEAAARQSMSLAAGSPQLVREGGGQNFTLRSNVLIGRAPDCDICVSHAGVSGRHARIYRQGDRWYVEDLGSTNGTFVGDSAVQGRVEVRDQDRISFARLTFQFVAPSAGNGRRSSEPAASPKEVVRIHHGRLTPELLVRELPSTNYLYFLCGPAAMMNDIGDGLEAVRVPKSDIRFEAFGPATRSSRGGPMKSVAGSPSSVEVRFARSNVSRRWNPLAGNLLAFAVEAGVSIPSGCCAGSCGTCLVAVREGSFEYVGEGGAETEPGSCLACIAVPKTNLVLDA